MKKDPEIEQKIARLQELSSYYEELGLMMRQYGAPIFEELKKRYDDYTNLMHGTSEAISDNYQFDPKTIRALENLHIRRNEILSLQAGLDPEFLITTAKDCKKQIELFEKGEALEAVYTN